MSLSLVFVCLLGSVTCACIDDIPLNQWPMLRSHNAGTGYISRAVPLWQVAKNQNENFTEQLNCGVRAFDLRPACTDDGIIMRHGRFRIPYRLEDAMRETITWANRNPQELVVVSNSHYSPNNADCRNKVWELMNNLKLMRSVGSDGSCEQLRGMTVGDAKQLSRTGGGGHVFIVEGEGMCSDANWDSSLTCYRADGNCHRGSPRSEQITQELLTYIRATASAKPRADRLFTIQAHWQYNTQSVLDMLDAGSDILMDTQRSDINNIASGMIFDLEYINFFQVDNACLYGPVMVFALRLKALGFVN